MISVAILPLPSKDPPLAFLSFEALCRFFPLQCVLVCEDRSFRALPELCRSWMSLSLEPALLHISQAYPFCWLIFSNICSHLLSLVLLIKEKEKKKTFEESSIFSTSFPLIWFDILPPPLLKALLWNNYWLSDQQLWWPLSLQVQVTTTAERNSFHGSKISAAF